MGPIFTESQISCLNVFFKDLEVRDWNALPEGDPTWEKCVTKIAEALSRRKYEGYALIKPLSDRGIALLRTAFEERKIKQFFQKHLLTSMSEVNERRAAFAGNVPVNQMAKYTCLLPYSRGAIVQDRYLYAENTPIELGVPIGGIDDMVRHTPNADRRFTSSECLDLYLTRDIKDVPLYSSLDIGGGSQSGGSSPTLRGWHEMDACWEPTVILPDDDEADSKPIRGIFDRKIEIFRATSHERMSHSPRCLTLAASVAFLACSVLFTAYNQ